MKGLFSSKSKKIKIQFVDLEGRPLKEGDTVMSLRYDLGECRIINTDEGMVYESISTGNKVNYARMIDAASGYQKVQLLDT